MNNWVDKCLNRFNFRKLPVKVFFVLSVVVVSAVLLVLLLLEVNSNYGYVFLYKTINFESFIIVMLVLFMFCFTGMIAVALIIKLRFKVIIISSSILISFFILFNYLWGYDVLGYLSYHSPDMQTTVVVEETGVLWYGSISCFVRDNAFFVKRLDGFIYKYGFYPGQCSLVWIDNENFSVYSPAGAKINVNIDDILPKGATATNSVNADNTFP